MKAKKIEALLELNVFTNQEIAQMMGVSIEKVNRIDGKIVNEEDVKKPLKRGASRIYFPDHKNHYLNGASFERCGKYVGEVDGVKARKELSVFENTSHNQTNTSGYWQDSFLINPDMFGEDIVKVRFYFCGQFEEEFYLIK